MRTKLSVAPALITRRNERRRRCGRRGSWYGSSCSSSYRLGKSAKADHWLSAGRVVTTRRAGRYHRRGQHGSWCESSWDSSSWVCRSAIARIADHSVYDGNRARLAAATRLANFTRTASAHLGTNLHGQLPLEYGKSAIAKIADHFGFRAKWDVLTRSRAARRCTPDRRGSWS